jgi:hypothetical protein
MATVLDPGTVSATHAWLETHVREIGENHAGVRRSNACVDGGSLRMASAQKYFVIMLNVKV